MPNNPKAFNSDIISTTCTLGFGGQESSLSLKLADCGNYNGSLGCVYTVDIGAFSFTGVLADHTYEESSGGFIWNVRLTDGRQSLSNVSLILDDYYCNVAVPNLINVLARLEPSVCNFNCQDFMASFKDEGGIPMVFVLRAIHGSSVLLPVCGETLTLDVSAVIAICPFYFKVNEGSSNVLNIIDQACQEAGYDFTISIVGSSFVVRTINKKSEPSDGELLLLLNTISANSCGGKGKINYSYGEETSYEPSKKFVIGENIHYLTTINKAGSCVNVPQGGDFGGPPPDIENPPDIERPPPPNAEPPFDPYPPDPPNPPSSFPPSAGDA